MADLIISVDRKWKKEEYTISNMVLMRGGVQLMRTNCIEDKDRGLKQSMPFGEIVKRKVYGVTAIPSGRYQVRLSYSQKFGAKDGYSWCNGMLPEVMDVPGYSGVRIHAGNSAKDSLGCLLPGKNDKPGWVSNSMQTVKLMYNHIKEALKDGDKVWLVISA